MPPATSIVSILFPLIGFDIPWFECFPDFIEMVKSILGSSDTGIMIAMAAPGLNREKLANYLDYFVA